MPDSNSSDDYNGIVQSDGGTNVTPALICNSHFFLETKSATDYESAFTQLAANKFGAVDSDKFRTTSKITLDDGDKKLYAICDGQVFLQPTTGASGKVNLILKPFEQPIPSLGIKYFIFRNLPFAEFFDGVNVKARTASSDPDNPDDPNATDFINLLWNQFEKYNAQEGQALDPFQASFIGYQTFPVEKPLHEVFFKISTEIAEVQDPNGEPGEMIDVEQESTDTSVWYELPLVKKGMHLCTIADADSIGVDVVLDHGDYIVPNDPNPFKFDLAFARSADHVLDITTPDLIGETGDSAERLAYLTKVYKESCTQFIDICAFYGLHAEAGKLYANGDNDTVLEQTDLVSAISGFETKHTIYLYIQANRQRSYNFYGNYEIGNGNSIKVGYETHNLLEKDYESLTWPVHMDNNIPLSPNSDAPYYIQVTIDNDVRPSVFVHLGKVLTPNDQNFITEDVLMSEVDEFSNTIGFKLNYNVSNPISRLFQVVVKGRKDIIPAFVPMEYASAEEVTVELKTIDDHFCLSTAYNKFNSKETDSTILTQSRLSLYNYFHEDEVKGSGVVKQRQKDLKIRMESSANKNLVVIEEVLFELGRKASSPSQNISEEKSSTLSNSIKNVGFSKFYALIGRSGLEVQPFSINGSYINGLKLILSKNTVTAKKMLGISKTEHSRILGMIENEPINNPRFYFKTEEYETNRKYTSSEGISFERYQLMVIGEDATGQLIIRPPMPLEGQTEFSSIHIYSLDGKTFFSKEFTEIEFTNSSNFYNIKSEI